MDTLLFSLMAASLLECVNSIANWCKAFPLYFGSLLL